MFRTKLMNPLFFFRSAKNIALLSFLIPSIVISAGWETSHPKDVKAFETGNLPAIKRILVKDNYIEGDPRFLRFALEKAISSGNVDLLRYLNDRGWLQKCRQLECYPVHEAARHGRVEIIKFLGAEGFDAKAVDNVNSEYGGNTPLHYAASRGHLETVKLLCELNVDARLKNRKGDTALDLAQFQLDINHGGTKKEEEMAKVRFRKIVEYLANRDCTKK